MKKWRLSPTCTLPDSDLTFKQDISAAVINKHIDDIITFPRELIWIEVNKIIEIKAMRLVLYHNVIRERRAYHKSIRILTKYRGFKPPRIH
jgi:hypothetical protein